MRQMITYFVGSLFAIVLLFQNANPQVPASQSASNSNVRPAVTKADLQIVKRAREILNAESKWNRADNRVCPAEAKTISLYCALQMATIEVVAKSEHRGAALQEARFVVDEIAADRNYEHRLMNYNNDPTTTFADIQEVLRITESLITLRLKANGNKIISGASIVTHAGQTVTQEALNTDCIALRMVQQKPAPKIKGKPAPDVIVTVPDDLSIRFELRNNCKQDIYYLAETVGEDKRAPTGFLIYRDKDKEWKARTPTWRREGSLTDPYLYYWLPLRVGERVEFEYTDLSRIEGERSLAVYLNESPCNEKRVELLAEPFTINKQRLK